LNRRNFLRSLGIILAVGSIPMVTIPAIGAKPAFRRLKARWSVELEQDLQAFHGLNAEDELISIISEDMKEKYPNYKMVSKKIKNIKKPHPSREITIDFV
jgi:hypothetical protein